MGMFSVVWKYSGNKTVKRSSFSIGLSREQRNATPLPLDQGMMPFLTCLTSLSLHLANSCDASCSGVIRTSRSAATSPDSTCWNRACNSKGTERHMGFRSADKSHTGFYQLEVDKGLLNAVESESKLTSSVKTPD